MLLGVRVTHEFFFILSVIHKNVYLAIEAFPRRKSRILWLDIKSKYSKWLAFFIVVILVFFGYIVIFSSAESV